MSCKIYATILQRNKTQENVEVAILLEITKRTNGIVNGILEDVNKKKF